MGGIDNLAGVDFQITYCVYRILTLLKHNSPFSYVQFEGLDDEGQDFTLQKSAQEAELVQIKKKGEGYLWTPSSIKPVIEKFMRCYSAENAYVFFSDGSLNTELIDLRERLENYLLIEDKILSSLQPPGATRTELLAFLARFSFLTRQYASADPYDPALNLRKECKSILGGAPFTPLLDVNQSYEALWSLVFERSRLNGRLTYEDLHLHAKGTGLIRIFSGFPILSSEDYRREREVEDIVAKHDTCEVVFVYGLSGTGKSTTVAQSLLERKALGKVLWFSTSPSYDSRYFRQMVAAFLETAGHPNQALPLRDMGLEDLDAIDHVLTQVDVTVVFDGAEEASSSMEFLWSSLLRRKASSNRKAKIVFVRQELAKWFLDSQAYVKSSCSYHLKGFTYDDFVSYIGAHGNAVNEDDLLNFFDKTGGLPIAASLLKAALTSEEQLDASRVFDESSETIHRMLFSSVISTLDETEREFVEAASVFNTEFSLEEVNLLLDHPLKSRSKILSLIPKCIVNEFENGMQLHDSIRPLAYALLLKDTAEMYHEKLAAHYLGLMKVQGSLFELINKWGYHLSRCDKLQSDFMKAVNSLQPYEVFSLWGIYYAGFPFSFSENDLLGQLTCIGDFVENGLIQVSANYNSNRRTFDVAASKQLLGINGADERDLAFLWHIAERDTPASHMGYIDVNEPNFSWQLQRHTVCPWEHRIEYEPLMSYDETASEVRAWFADVIKSGGLSWRGSEANDNTLRELDDLLLREDVEAGDLRLRAAVGACPIFGHCCPGGSTQASICRTAKDEKE